MTALVVIDVQQSFQHRPFWREDEVPAFRSNLIELDAACRARGIPVLHVLHEAPGTGGPFDPAGGHVRLMDWVPGPAEAVFRKHVHSALVESGLREWLEKHRIRRLIVCGMRTEQCCETTARHAADLGYQVDFVTEATLTFPMKHGSGRIYSPAEIRERTELVLAGRFARIATVGSLLASLDGAANAS